MATLIGECCYMYMSENFKSLGDSTKIVDWLNVQNYKYNYAKLTLRKIQLLLYLVQGVSLAVYNQPAFSDDIIIGGFDGLNIPEDAYIENLLIGYYYLPNPTQKSCENYNYINKNNKLVNVLKAVFLEYGNWSTYQLLDIIKHESLWKNTQRKLAYEKHNTDTSINPAPYPLSVAISKNDIRNFFKSFVVDSVAK